MTTNAADSSSSTDSRHPYLNKDQQKIRRLFDGIAPRYDFLNHLLSFNLDPHWRKRAVAKLDLHDHGIYLDACTGTGDLSLTLARALSQFEHCQIFASDFSLQMLQHGASKRASKGPQPQLLAGDTLRLPFAEDVFAGATVGFGIRNVENLDAGLQELRRVLKPDAKLVLLEFTAIQTPVLKQAVNFYCETLLPKIGNWISGTQDDAYSYLNQSISSWPPGEQLADIMTRCGFHSVNWCRLLPGNVALHIGSA